MMVSSLVGLVPPVRYRTVRYWSLGTRRDPRPPDRLCESAALRQSPSRRTVSDQRGRDSGQ
eukprot:759379-Hanusia_phi.AAC.3